MGSFGHGPAGGHDAWLIESQIAQQFRALAVFDKAIGNAQSLDPAAVEAEVRGGSTTTVSIVLPK